jgi:hypothetical protein
MCTFNVTVNDTESPVISSLAQDLTVECDGAGNTADLNVWLNSQGGASATDNCSFTWSDNFTALSDDCGATGSVTVTFTATDPSLNSAGTTATFTIVDTTPPSIGTAASNKTVECDGTGNTAELDAWLAANGGASASDACGGVTWSDDFTALSDDCGETGSATVTFTATDDCGLTNTTMATFTIVDTTPPDISFSNDGNDVSGTIEMKPNEVPVTIDVSATDVCGDATITNITVTCHMVTKKGKIIDKSESCEIEIVGNQVTIIDSGGVGDIITIFVDAEDECGNTASAELVIEVVNPGKGKT